MLADRGSLVRDWIIHFGWAATACGLGSAFLIGTLAAPAHAQETIPLWPKGAPGFEERRHEPEAAESYWVKNVHNPTLTAFLPDEELATGAAAVICPGGGHRLLVYEAEGVDAAHYLNSLGVTAFVLKYRLGREPESPYEIEVHAKQDGLRAMRLVRSRAQQWKLDPQRIGIVGFSAGGEVVSLVAYADHQGQTDSPDSVERVSARPDFQVLIYPGGIGIPDQIPPDSPPAFMLVTDPDTAAAKNVLDLLTKLRAADVSVECHLFALGKHGFNMGQRSKLKTLSQWPDRLGDWMSDNGLLREQSTQP